MRKLTLFAVSAALVPSAAFADDASGPRLEARFGYETPTISQATDVFKIDSAISYGAEAGYDLNFGGALTVGPYANYEFSSVKACDGADCLQVDGNLSVGGRVAYKIGGSASVYIKGAYSKLKIKGESATGTATESKSGPQGAVGATIGLGRNLYALGEISYSDLGDLGDFKLKRKNVAFGLGMRF
jgi:outer membrane immunogenic protein